MVIKYEDIKYVIVYTYIRDALNGHLYNLQRVKHYTLAHRLLDIHQYHIRPGETPLMTTANTFAETANEQAEAEIDVVAIMDKMIHTYQSMNRQLYKPLASTIHNHVPFSAQLGTTEFSTVGLWFIAMFGTQYDTTIDAETYMSRAVDPVLGHELHTMLLILNNEYDIAMQFDGRFETEQRKAVKTQLIEKFAHSVYNDWNEFDKHMLELINIRNVFDEALTSKV